MDLLFPPHRDAVLASSIKEVDVMKHLNFKYQSKHGTYTGLSYRDKNVRALIKANKFHHNVPAAHVLGNILGEMLIALSEENELAFGTQKPVLIPIPSSSKRLRERGGNQVEWIIQYVPKEIFESYEYVPSAVVREHRESQTRMEKEKRFDNVRGAFSVIEPQTVASRQIILIDDVIESGATMKNASQALYKAGAQNVIGLALAS